MTTATDLRMAARGAQQRPAAMRVWIPRATI